jgi:PAS domain-containing protein
MSSHANSGLDLVQQALIGEAMDGLVGVAVFVWNEDRRYVAVNEEACKLVSRTREEILDMKVGELTPDGAVEEIDWTQHAAIVRGGSIVRRPDGDVEIEWVTCHTVVANLPHMVSFCWRRGAAAPFPAA